MTASISSLMTAAGQGDAQAVEGLFTALYAELRRLAQHQLGRGGRVTLGATTLLHEAYLDIGRREGAAFPDRARFMGYAARVMRGLIIDHVRNRRAQKRGGLFHLTSLNGDEPAAVPERRELEQISDALDELAAIEPALAEIVDLKFFCGFSFAEIATMRGVSERTVQRNWEKARIYLHQSIRSEALD